MQGTTRIENLDGLAWQPPYLLITLGCLWLALVLSLGPLCPRSSCTQPLGSAVRLRF